MTDLGAYIRERRTTRHISVRDLAKRIDLSPAFLSDIELGRRHPSEESLGKIARVLGVSVAELRGRDSRPPIEDIKRLAESDPQFSAALRAVVKAKLSGRQLLKMLERRKPE